MMNVAFKKRSKKGKHNKNKRVRHREDDEDVNEHVNIVKKTKIQKGLTINSNKKKSNNTTTIEDHSYESIRGITPADKNNSHTVIIDKKKPRNASDMNKPKWKIGPKPMAANLRVVSFMDYNPLICKDYKQSGYCGFGDACIFIHDRGDYKSGWEQEKEYQEEQEAKYKAAMKRMNGNNDDDDEYEIKDDGLPWVCPICNKEFVNPVRTKCGHYFDERCALNRHINNPKCYVCHEKTNGIFNTATMLINIMKLRKEQGLKPPHLQDEEDDDELDNNII